MLRNNTISAVCFRFNSVKSLKYLKSHKLLKNQVYRLNAEICGEKTE